MLKLKLRSWFYGQLISRDSFGNRYYRLRKYKGAWKKEPRWVLYKGLAQASKIPPLWYGWLHHTTELPVTSHKKRYPWEKPHRPALTGTPHAFCPTHSPSVRAQEKSYTRWTPHTEAFLEPPASS